MQTETKDKQPSLGSGLSAILRIAAAIVVLIGIIIYVLLSAKCNGPGPTDTPTDAPTHTPPPTFTPRFVTPTATPSPTATHTPTPTPTPIVIGWHELAELTVIEYTGKTVSELRGETTFWGTDWILLEVTGTVKISIDMEQIEDSDVQVEGTRVRVALPPPAIAGVEIPEGQARAYVNKKKVLFSEFDELYQIQALDQAKQQLQDWFAEDENWIHIAEEVARGRLTAFLRQLGFEDITIVFKEPAEAG